MNKFQFMGRLTRDPEARVTPNTNTPVTTFSVAVNRRFADANGERKADFFNLTAYGKLADFCAKLIQATKVFDKNMDEIVYFFEETLYDTVFIEDLDRFDSSEIFIKLRELNAILNNYDLIKRRIVFVYAIKDDIFKNEERTKFFDFIIPVIPITNSTNSGEKLREKLKFKTDEKGVYKSTIYNISNSYVTLISPFIKDMRVLTSICNEFAVYKNTLKSLRLNDEKMFSLMIFKNLFPTEFAELPLGCACPEFRPHSKNVP